MTAWTEFLDRKLSEGWRRGVEIDPLEYPDRTHEGLEGPIGTASGKVLYYDPKEGKYYDPKTDIYVDEEEYRALNHSDAPMMQSPLDDPRSKEYRHMQQHGV